VKINGKHLGGTSMRAVGGPRKMKKGESSKGCRKKGDRELGLRTDSNNKNGREEGGGKVPKTKL